MQAGATAGGDIGATLVTSVAVLGLVCLAAFLLIRFGGRWLWSARQHGNALLDIVAQVPLEPRRSLFVVSVAGKTLLVGTSEMGLAVLAELDSETVRSSVGRSSGPRSFTELVRSLSHRRAAPPPPGPHG